MWLPGQRQHAWEDIQQLFRAQQLPPVTAAHFLISAAEGLAKEGMLNVQEQVLLIKVDLTNWTPLKTACTDVKQACVPFVVLL